MNYVPVVNRYQTYEGWIPSATPSVSPGGIAWEPGGLNLREHFT
jgi:hypothetical protein